MEIRFITIAQIELDEAIEYYKAESPGLEEDFLIDVLKALERIKAFPMAWHSLTENIRRCRLRRFPYGIIYNIIEEEIMIIAIANAHRKPDYWKKRTLVE